MFRETLYLPGEKRNRFFFGNSDDFSFFGRFSESIQIFGPEEFEKKNIYDGNKGLEIDEFLMIMAI